MRIFFAHWKKNIQFPVTLFFQVFRGSVLEIYDYFSIVCFPYFFMRKASSHIENDPQSKFQAFRAKVELVFVTRRIEETSCFFSHSSSTDERCPRSNVHAISVAKIKSFLLWNTIFPIGQRAQWPSWTGHIELSICDLFFFFVSFRARHRKRVASSFPGESSKRVREK